MIISIEKGGKDTSLIQRENQFASLHEVREMMDACARHLADFDQAEIDAMNAYWIRQTEERDRAYFSQGKAEKKTDRTGFVYIMLNRRNGLFKIGFSKSPKHRESTLASEEPEISLLGTIPGTMNDEAALHDRFYLERVRGEWFKLDRSDVDSLLKEWGASL